MGKTRLTPRAALGVLVAIALLFSGAAAAASDRPLPADADARAEADPLRAEQLTIHWIGPERRPGEPLLTKLEPRDAERLDAFFERQGFLMAGIRGGGRAVPRVYVTRLPADLDALRRVERRKQLFLRSVLPLILMANEELRTRRGRLLSLQERLRAGDRLGAADRAWLASLAEDYGAPPDRIEELLLRVDEVPVSLALGQAILESGWGTSRFAIEGNALFGETTPSSTGEHLVKRDGSRKRFRAFPDLMASVRSYMHNLNTHAAYRKFRKLRAAQRAKGVLPSGKLLLPTLERYAELPDYLKLVGSLMRSNKLEQLESARLDRDWFASRRLNF